MRNVFSRFSPLSTGTFCWQIFFFLFFISFFLHLFPNRYCNDLASSSLLVRELESVGFRLREVKDTTQEWTQHVVTRVEDWKKKYSKQQNRWVKVRVRGAVDWWSILMVLVDGFGGVVWAEENVYTDVFFLFFFFFFFFFLSCSFSHLLSITEGYSDLLKFYTMIRDMFVGGNVGGVLICVTKPKGWWG